MTDGFVISKIAEAEPCYPDADVISRFPVLQRTQPLREWRAPVVRYIRDDLSISTLRHIPSVAYKLLFCNALGVRPINSLTGQVSEASPAIFLIRPTGLPRTMRRPLVKLTSSWICVISSHPDWRRAGVMNLVQMSRSLRLVLSIPIRFPPLELYRTRQRKQTPAHEGNNFFKPGSVTASWTRTDVGVPLGSLLART